MHKLLSAYVFNVPQITHQQDVLKVSCVVTKQHLIASEAAVKSVLMQQKQQIVAPAGFAMLTTLVN
jgi:hypothetical protein